MARPLRIEFEGALYHVTARGNERKPIVRDDGDRRTWLATLAKTVSRFGWLLHAWCLMDNHHHLVVETPNANLARGMRQLNGVYAQRLNDRYGRSGHLFGGRYKALLVQGNAHLLELARYVVLNPVRAGICARPEHYRWSSYRATAGLEPQPHFRETPWTLSQFGADRKNARARHRAFVAARIGLPPPEPLGGIYVGDEDFARRHRDHKRASEVPRQQREPLAVTAAALLGASQTVPC